MSVLRQTRYWLMQLYPPEWRAHYEEEFVALLEQCRLSPLVFLDILLGALDARIAPQDTTGRILRMINRPRRTAIAVFGAYIAFVVAGMGFQKLTEYDDFQSAGRAHAAIGVSFTIVEVGAAIALLAVLAGGVPIALAALRYALAARRADILVLFAVPVAAFAVLVGGAIALGQFVNSQPQRPAGTPPTAPEVGAFLVLIAIFIFLAIASTAAVSFAVARSEISARVLQFTRVPVLVTTVAMAAMFAAVLVWGLSLRANVPQLFDGNDGIVATSTAASWLVMLIVMGAATLVAVVALLRGGSATDQGLAGQPA